MVTWFGRKFDYSLTQNILPFNYRTVGWYVGARTAKNGKD